MTDTQQPREAGPVAPQTASEAASGVQEPHGAPDASGGRTAAPTLHHPSVADLRAQRARLVASTGMDEVTLRARAEAWQLYPEHLAAWNTVESIDYLLQDEAAEDKAPAVAQQAGPLTWAESIASHGIGDTATVDIDVNIPGRAEPGPMKIPRDAAEMLYAMLGDLLGETSVRCPGHETCDRCDVTDPCPCCGLTLVNGQWVTRDDALEQTRRQLAALKRAHVASASQAGKDQAALRRVRGLVDECDARGASSGYPLTVTALREAMDASPPADETPAEAARDDERYWAAKWDRGGEAS